MNAEVKLIDMGTAMPRKSRACSTIRRYARRLSDVAPFPYAESDACNFISAVLEDSSTFRNRTVLYKGRIAGIAG